MLELEIDLIERIAGQVPGFVTVANPSVLVGLKHIGPLLPACIVFPGGAEVSPGSHADHVLEEQEWDIVVIVEHQRNDTNKGKTEQLASGLMQQVFAAVHNWKSSRAGMRSGYAYQGREHPNYNLGYAEFPLTFLAKRVINNVN